MATDPFPVETILTAVLKLSQTSRAVVTMDGYRLAISLDVSPAPALASGVVDLLTRTTLLEFLTDTRCVPARPSLETSCTCS